MSTLLVCPHHPARTCVGPESGAKRSGVGTDILHFQQALECCCSWFGPRTYRLVLHSGIHPIANTIKKNFMSNWFTVLHCTEYKINLRQFVSSPRSYQLVISKNYWQYKTVWETQPLIKCKKCTYLLFLVSDIPPEDRKLIPYFEACHMTVSTLLLFFFI